MSTDRSRLPRIVDGMRTHSPLRPSLTIDPEDCGCTDCILREATHASSLSTEQVIDLLHGDLRLINRTSGNLVFTVEGHGFGYYNVHLMDPWTNERTGSTWIITDADLRSPVHTLALAFDEDGQVIGRPARHR